MLNRSLSRLYTINLKTMSGGHLTVIGIDESGKSKEALLCIVSLNIQLVSLITLRYFDFSVAEVIHIAVAY